MRTGAGGLRSRQFYLMEFLFAISLGCVACSIGIACGRSIERDYWELKCLQCGCAKMVISGGRMELRFNEDR